MRPANVKQIILSILLFGVAFGYLEAAVVSYLRDLHEPARQRFHPGRPQGDLFPLLTLEQLRDSGAVQPKTLAIEIGREVATLLMLAAIALAVARNAGEWAAAFAIAFGAWDIAFYVFLKVLLDWPGSLFTSDILFLVPVPWVGPVIAPVLVSIVMIGAGIYHLSREANRRPVRIGRLQWAGLLAGATTIIVSFALDYEHIMRGGMPLPFHWLLFGLGLGGGLLVYVKAALSPAAPPLPFAAAPGRSPDPSPTYPA
jgi:hypothetical protein